MKLAAVIYINTFYIQNYTILSVKNDWLHYHGWSTIKIYAIIFTKIFTKNIIKLTKTQ